eukprot:gnl/MRDRNA2_/MRDRNA2_69695_c0_seq1.p1 gnl/MRDRNA2_/MRDRNA2_69695_c0~~gnl/MRDRNA2_/MRDRNA2_69695_c0_seq1.p1  ORF type:complete len:503 (-),score=92.45 gnl/MRDRNA2_/MRDRNA2_69695_c0_seq1:98-1411(-)
MPQIDQHSDMDNITVAKPITQCSLHSSSVRNTQALHVRREAILPRIPNIWINSRPSQSFIKPGAAPDCVDPHNPEVKALQLNREGSVDAQDSSSVLKSEAADEGATVEISVHVEKAEGLAKGAGVANSKSEARRRSAGQKKENRRKKEKKKTRRLHGWLVVQKPTGILSREMVDQVAKKFRVRKLGCAGILDRMASGILPIALGECTKFIDFLHTFPKVYEVDMRFGSATDTGDSEGEVVATTEHIPTLEEIRHILPNFTGKLQQVPHRFSGVKVGGERAYDLARQGLDFELQSKTIEIYSLDLLKQRGDVFTLQVACSSGTYIRKLCEDMAESLGSYAFVARLERLRVGPFHQGTVIESIRESDVLSATDVSWMSDQICNCTIDEAKALRSGYSLKRQIAPGLYVGLDPTGVIGVLEASNQGVRVKSICNITGSRN